MLQVKIYIFKLYHYIEMSVVVYRHSNHHNHNNNKLTRLYKMLKYFFKENVAKIMHQIQSSYCQ